MLERGCGSLFLRGMVQKLSQVPLEMSAIFNRGPRRCIIWERKER